jgi:hypothetical protein
VVFNLAGFAGVSRHPPGLICLEAEMVSVVKRVAVCAAVLLGAANAKADTSDLYTTFNGVWSPTYEFTGNMVQYGSAPYAPAPVQFNLHAMDATHPDFGSLFVSGALSGRVVGLSETGSTVNMTVFYPDEGNPNGYGDFVGTKVGDTISGEFDERSPASPGYLHARGPMTITAVPEPSVIGVLIVASGMIWGRRRNGADRA